MATAAQSVAGVILAGGLARRMGGGDKCLLTLGGKTLLQQTIERAKPQVAGLILNANGDGLRFAQTQLPLVGDSFANNLGPLAGIHAGLQWMKGHTSLSWLASFPCDTPFFPLDLVEKLFAKTQVALAPAGSSGTGTLPNIVVASADQQLQSVFALWHISLLEPIAEQLRSGRIPRLQDWVAQQAMAQVAFNANNNSAFFNINTPQDLISAESLLSRKS